MVIREFSFRGRSIDEVKKMSIKDFAQLIPSRQRRSLMRGFTEDQKSLLKRLEKKLRGVKTHCRDIVVVPQMLDREIMVHSGKQFVSVIVTPEMLGHCLGEFVATRSKVSHNAPGIGATKSSGALSVR